MDFPVEARRRHRASDEGVDLRAAGRFELRYESGKQLQADRAVHAQIKGLAAGEKRGTADVEIRVGPTQVGLLDANFVPAIGQSDRADIFQFYILEIKGQA